MLPSFSDVLAMLRRAAEEHGADTPINKLPLDRDTADPNADPSSYTATKLNPAGGKKHVVYFYTDAEGVVFGTMGAHEEGDDTPDVHRADQIKMYAKRKKEWAEFSAQQAKRISMTRTEPT